MNNAVPTPRLIKPAVPLITWLTARYISHHRARLVHSSQPIKGEHQTQLREFFPGAILEDTRTVQAVMPDPMFYPLVRILGIRGLLEMSSIGAITLIDVIAYPEELDRGTLFHELVHAVQYRVLGLRRFAKLYVQGFLDGAGYEGIPLERQAYELETRFSRNPKEVFSVEEDVIRRHEAGRL
jgi:hypothetical protein